MAHGWALTTAVSRRASNEGRPSTLGPHIAREMVDQALKGPVTYSFNWRRLLFFSVGIGRRRGEGGGREEGRCLSLVRTVRMGWKGLRWARSTPQLEEGAGADSRATIFFFLAARRSSGSLEGGLWVEE